MDWLDTTYLSLCCAVIAYAIAAYLHILWNIGGLITTVATLGCMSITPYDIIAGLSITMLCPNSNCNRNLPLWNIGGLLITVATLGCMSWIHAIPPYHHHFGERIDRIRHRVCLFLGSCHVCKTQRASLSWRFSLLWFFNLFFVHFASSIFGGSVALFKRELYFGLLAYVGYMVINNQEIIEKVNLGDLDYINALPVSTIQIVFDTEKNEKKIQADD